MKNKDSQTKITQKKIENINQKLVTDPKNRQLNVDKAILTEFSTFLKNKK